MIQIDENWRQESGLYKCPHCSKEYSKSGIGPHIWRSHTEEGKKHKRTLSKIVFIPWNKGLTKETSEKIKESAENLKKRYKSGELVGSFLNKHHTEKDNPRDETSVHVYPKASLPM